MTFAAFCRVALVAATGMIPATPAVTATAPLSAPAIPGAKAQPVQAASSGGYRAKAAEIRETFSEKRAAAEQEFYRKMDAGADPDETQRAYMEKVQALRSEARRKIRALERQAAQGG